MTLAELPTNFRERAAFLRENAAAEQAATAWEKAAIELESALRGHELEALTLRAAAPECGYSVAHLRRLIRAGRTGAGRAGVGDRHATGADNED